MVYVLALSIYFPPEFGGGATRAWNLTNAMGRRGYKVVVIASYPQYPYGKIPTEYNQDGFLVKEKYDDITVLRFPLPTIPYFGFLRRLMLFLYYVILTWILIPIVLKKFGKPSIVYAMNPNLFSAFAAYPYCRLTGAKLILDVPDLWPEFITVRMSSLLTNLINGIGLTIAHFAFSISDNLTTVSDGLKKAISGYGIYLRRIYIIVTGVDIKEFQPITKMNAEHNLGSLLIKPIKGKFVVLYSGIIGPAYDLEILIKIASKLKDIKDIIFLIQGEGEHKAKLIGTCKEKGLKNVVFTFTHLPRMLMPQMINIADLCIIPFPEEPIFGVFFPVRFFEYTACGKPIIYISPKGQAAKLLIKWNAGIVVNSNQIDKAAASILELKRDNYKRRIMGHRARNLAEVCFSLKRIGEKVDYLLNSMK
jgi:colanic acid biosynthesis glycosyl transferase WcaI